MPYSRIVAALFLVVFLAGCTVAVSDEDGRGANVLVAPSSEQRQISKSGDATDTPSPTSTPTMTPKDREALAQLGLLLYKELYCGICHNLDAAGTGGLFGPNHNGIGTVAAQRIQEPNYAGEAATAAEYLRESIVNPGVYVVAGYAVTPHHMPVYDYLDEGDVDALVQMLLEQR